MVLACGIWYSPPVVARRREFNSRLCRYGATLIVLLR